MANITMMFPNTVREFMEQNKIVDTEQIYTNGAELVPIFRMEQWFISHPCEPPQWIPVEDGLPEEDGRYLVTRYDDVTNTEFIDILWYEENLWWNRYSTGDYAVTAWMPLPEPYKEGE